MGNGSGQGEGAGGAGKNEGSAAGNQREKPEKTADEAGESEFRRDRYARSANVPGGRAGRGAGRTRCEKLSAEGTEMAPGARDAGYKIYIRNGMHGEKRRDETHPPSYHDERHAEGRGGGALEDGTGEREETAAG